jgi:MFS family permease
VGRKPVVVCGWLVYAVVYLGFAATRSLLAPWFLFAAYGLYQAMTEGVTKALVTDQVPHEQRAGAIGLFYTVSGLGQLAASLLAGSLWHRQVLNGRLMVPFLIGGVCAALAVPIIATVPLSPRADHE